jgi:hypothetical protein
MAAIPFFNSWHSHPHLSAFQGTTKPRPPQLGHFDGVLLGIPKIQPKPLGRCAYALAILPLLMQLVHTRMRLGAPLTSALTA